MNIKCDKCQGILSSQIPTPNIVDCIKVFDTAYSAEDIKRLLNELMVYKRTEADK